MLAEAAVDAGKNIGPARVVIGVRYGRKAYIQLHAWYARLATARPKVPRGYRGSTLEDISEAISDVALSLTLDMMRIRKRYPCPEAASEPKIG